MTHFSTQETPSTALWMRFSDYEGEQESRWSVTADTSLTVSLCRASNTVSCLVFAGSQSRTSWELAQKFAFSLLSLVLLWLMAVSGCVWERGGECRLGAWPESPLFATYHAKVLLIRLIKCFVGTGPTLHATNTSSSSTPTPPLHPFIFHRFPLELLSPFIITSEALAPFSLAGCQWMFLPVKFWDITVILLLFHLDNQQCNNCLYVWLHDKETKPIYKLICERL